MKKILIAVFALAVAAANAQSPSTSVEQRMAYIFSNVVKMKQEMKQAKLDPSKQRQCELRLRDFKQEYESLVIPNEDISTKKSKILKCAKYLKQELRNCKSDSRRNEIIEILKLLKQQYEATK